MPPDTASLTLTPSTSPAPLTRSSALFGLFVLVGLATSTWVTRTPALRDALQASTEQMGMVLFGFSLGSMLGILTANALTQRLHARRATGLGMVINLCGLALLALGTGYASVPLAFAGFVLFGLGMGWSDIAVNVECAALENAVARPLLTTLHGCFSLGALLGALLGSLMAWQNVPVLWHLLGVAGVAAMLSAPLLRQIHNTSAQAAQAAPGTLADTTAGSGSMLQAFKQRGVLLIGLFALGLALAEGAAHDWLPLLMVDGYGFAPAQGTLIYMLFTLGMAVGRFSGQALLRRVERHTLMRASACAAACGLALVIVAQHPLLGALAVVLWGLGAALGFPLALSAAAEGGGASAPRVSAVATLGYVAILVGPPLLGFLGEHHGLRLAMLPVLTMVAIAWAVAYTLRPQGLQLREVKAG
ncbi:MAG: MFS transporter [Acidovorax sp.]|jgi:fucose permease|nr:MFS transporter [Acidovorax sp.]